MACGNEKAPPGYWCSRETGHEGPCAAHPVCGHDNFTFHPPLAVRCPCVHADNNHCPGELMFDGLNRPNTKAFLSCSHCKCCYAVEKLRD